MGRRLTSLLVDEELLEEAKRLGVNISRFLEECLEKLLEKEMRFKEYEEVLEEIAQYEKQLQDLKDRINIAIEKAKKQEELFKVLDGIPELQTLTSDDLKDMDFLMSLVKRIKEKYNIRIGIMDIKDYLRIKGR